jgi:hypothetical protein
MTPGIEFEVAPTIETGSVPVKPGFNYIDNVVDKKPPQLLLQGVDSAFMISPHTHGQIASHLDIPKRYYDTMLKENPDLLSLTVNTLFRRKPAPRLVRTLDGRARAFSSEQISHHRQLPDRQSRTRSHAGQRGQHRQLRVTNQNLHQRASRRPKPR